MNANIIRFVFFVSLITSSIAAFAVTPMVAAGYDHSVVLNSDGTVMEWGRNHKGQLGDGTTTNHSSPVMVPGLTDVVAVAAGRWHTIALKADGTVLTWGYNGNGQLGDGTTLDRLSPVVVPGLNGVVAVAAGFNHTVAVKSDGTVAAWGLNSYGQLGDGTTTQRNSPVAVQGLSGVKAIAGGRYHTVALKNDGTLMAWGYGGTLGDGTTWHHLSPGAVPGLSGVAAVAVGRWHTIALKDDGTVVAWGYNGYGQLGDGTTSDRSRPVAVPGLSGVAALAAGGDHTAALKLDGTILAWGDNTFGELGDGTTVGRLSPEGVLGFGGSAHPALTYSTLGGYGTGVGVLPANGFLSTLLNYKVVYSHAANTGPSVISVCIDAQPCIAMNVDTSAAAPSRDGDYTNGEQYVYTTTLPAGTHSYYFTASDGAISTNLPATGSLSGPTISDLSITTSSLPDGTVGVAYSQTLAATGGTPPYSWSSGGLPPGLSLNASTGEIAGTPTTAGTYGFSVAVQDAAGTSTSKAFSIIVAVNPAITVPGAPTGLACASGSSSAICSFTAPANDGGSAIIDYTVTCIENGIVPGGTSIATGAASPITVTGMINGTSYICTVVANNSEGSSSPSNNAYVIPGSSATEPGAPTIGTATAGDARATVSFTPPASNGGSAITSYTVSCSPACTPKSGTASPITVTGLTNGTTYTFTVTATNSVGTGPASAASNSVTPLGTPSVPTGLTVTYISSTQNNLSWTASPSDMYVTQYKIYRSAPNDCPIEQFGLPCSPRTLTLIATLSGSPPATSYSDISGTGFIDPGYSVAACNVLGACSARSAEVYPIYPDTTPPTTPSELSASAVSETKIDLSWSPSTDNVGVTRYRVYRKSCPVSLPDCVSYVGPVLIQTLSGAPPVTTYSDTEVSVGLSYDYYVDACDSANNCSAWSSMARANPLDSTAPTVPTGLSASAVSATQINLGWTASNDNVGVTDYTIYRDGVQVGTTIGTSYSDTSLAPLTSYSYTVSACDAAGNCSAQSAAATATTLEGEAPTVPGKLSARASSTTQIDLSWRDSTDNVGVTGYTVYRDGVQLGTTAGTSFSDTGLTAATSYQYTVAACDAAGNCSAQSSAETGTTKRK